MATVTSAVARPGFGLFGLLAGSFLLLLPLLALVVGNNEPSTDIPAMPTHAWTTLLLAAGAASGATIIGMPLAVALRSFKREAAFLVIAVLSLPLAIPGYVHALAWSAWLGLAPAGISVVRSGASVPGSVACLWVWSVTWAPLVMLMTDASLASWSKAWTEASAMSGLSPCHQLLLRLRHMAPMAASGMLLVAVMVFADFAVADFFSVGTYATAVFVQLSAYADVTGAVRASLPAVALMGVLAICLAVSWNRAEKIRRAEVRKPQSKQESTSRERTAIAWVVVGIGVVVLVLVPIASLVAMVRRPEDLITAGGVLLEESASSLGLAIFATLIVIALAISGGHSLARRATRASAAFRGVVLAIIVICVKYLGDFDGQPTK